MRAKIDPRAIVGDLSFVDRQMVEIARALRVDEMVHAAPLVILDEPTSVLERDETEILEREIRDLKNIGSVIFVSHRLDEVLRICDRVVVMRARRDRRRPGHRRRHRGRALPAHDRPQRAAPNARARPRSGAAEPVLEVEGLGRKGAFTDVSFALGPGTSDDRRHERLRPGVGLPRDLRRRAVRPRRLPDRASRSGPGR